LSVVVEQLRQGSEWLIVTYQLPFTVEVLTTIVVASVLSAVWGAAYHLSKGEP
jgi:hypothetical protein